MYKDDLGDRMKKYEYITRTHLVPRMPVIIRLDGKAFHTFTRGFKKPFDDILIASMQDTMKKLCENVQGCVLGYTQSDEITLVLVDYQKLNTSSWFDYNIQKCCSVVASMATCYFSRAFAGRCFEYEAFAEDFDEGYYKTIVNAAQRGALFDARVFNVPKEEVTNCLLWRQNDAARNSVSMVGQAYYSAKQLHGKGSAAIKEMLAKEKNIVWDDLPTYYKHGSCCVHIQDENNRSNWVIDRDIPVWKGTGRAYVEDRIWIGET